jgi:hypothetical protein
MKFAACAGRSATRSLAAPALALLASAAAFPAAAAGARAVKLHYEADLLGIEALAFTIAVAEDGDRYRVQVEGATEGVIDLVAGWRSWNEVAGAVSGGDIRPAEYRALNRIRDKRSTIAMDFARNGDIDAIIDPPPSDDHAAVTPDQRRAAVDALSAGLVLGQALAATGRCDARAPVFDGRRRYDVVTEDDGPATLAQQDGAHRDGSRWDGLAVTGPVRNCRLHIHRIAGFKNKNYVYDKPEYRDERYPMVVGAVAEGLPPMALEVSGKFSLGSFRIHAVRIETGPEDKLFDAGP